MIMTPQFKKKKKAVFHFEIKPTHSDGSAGDRKSHYE